MSVPSTLPLEPTPARLYALIALAAAVALVFAVAAGNMPIWALLSLIGMLPSIHAAKQLARDCARPLALAPAIRATLLAAHLHAIMLALTLMMESGK